MGRLRSLRTIFAGLGLVLLAGCAEQLIRRESDAQLRQGQYEAAIGTLRDGAARYPDSVLLRAALSQAKERAVEGLFRQAGLGIAASRFEEANAALRRVLALEPENGRALKLMQDADAQRRAMQASDEARAALAGAKHDAAHALAETRPVSLDFRGAPLTLVLDAVTRNSGINFVVDRDVRPDIRLTLAVRAVPVEDAIELVATAGNLARRIVDTQTVLLYPNTPEKHREHQEQVIRVFRLAHADPKSIAAMLKNVLRLKEPFVDERANTIVLREAPEIIAIAERLVALQDVGEAEVMLEVEVLEITGTKLSELGLNPPSAITLTPLDLAGAASGLTLGNLRQMNAGRVGVGVGSLALNLHSEDDDIQLLANPRVRTKSRDKARILIGDKVPVFTSTTNSTGFVSESVNYLDVGLKLDVEPTVSPDDEVTLKLGLEVSSITNQVRTASGSLAYQIGTRNATTTLRLRDGETQVLGGLISAQDRAGARKVPGLGDLPLVGRLFSSHSYNSARTELVLAITPHVVHSQARPDRGEARMSVGTENFTRLRPMAVAPAPGAAPAAVPSAGSAPAGSTSTAPSPLTPVLATWSVPASATVGEEFLATLHVQSSSPVHALPLEILFQADRLEFIGVSEGPFLRQERIDTSFSHALSGARLSVGLLRNDAGGATGTGDALSIRFKAKSAGPAQVSLAGARPIGVDGRLLMGSMPAATIDVKAH